MKKKLFGLLACIMMFALAFGLVACGGDTDDGENPSGETVTYTVTFVNGEQTVKTSKVEKGEALDAADFPADPTPAENQQFDGWFAGEEKLSVGFVPESDITANAKFSDIASVVPAQYTVTFVVEDKTVKTVTVEEGKTIAEADLPSDPDKEHYTFDGWFDAEGREFDEEAAVNASATYTAKFTQADYLVTFEQEGQEDKTVWVTKASGKLGTLPQNVAVDGSVFLGWYNEGEKATEDTDVASDLTFHAVFVSEADYTGVWFNDEQKVQLFFGQDKTIYFRKETIGKGTFNAEDGTLGYETESLYTDEWSFLIVEDTMTATHSYWDDVYEQTTSDTYTLTKAEEGFALAGIYRKVGGSSSYLEISDGGIVTYFNTSVYYGRVVAEGDAYKLDLYTSESSFKTLNITVDDKGNLLITGEGAENGQKGIFVKNSDNDAFESLDHEYGEYLYIHTVGEEKVYVYSDNETDTFYYVTVEGNLEVGEIVTLTKEGDPSVTHLIKIVEEGDFVFAGEERGTYTLAEADNLELDGFGMATLGEAEPVEYYIVGNKVVAGENGYQIDTEKDTYTVLEKETGNHVGEFKNVNSSSYTAVLDGFGIVITKTYSYVYYGAYTIEGTTLTVEGMEENLGSYYLANGTYTLAEDEKVIYSEDEKTVFAKEDYEMYSKLGQFTGANEGYWTKDGGEGEYIEITVKDNKITKFDYNGTEISDSYITLRYDGSKITITTYSPARELTLTIEDGKLKVNGTIGEDTVADTYTSVAKPALKKDAFAGGWEGEIFSSTSIFWFDGFGKGLKISGNSKDEFNYTVKGNVVTFSIGSYDYTCTLTGDTIDVDCLEDYEYSYDATLTKKAPDKFEGVWTSETVNYIFTFTGYGYVHVKYSTSYDEYVKYELNDNQATFEAYYENWTCTLQEDGAKMSASSIDSDGYASVNADFTREADSEEGGDLDAFAGTWKFDSITVVFDGKGGVTYDGKNYTYTINGEGKAVFNNGSYDITCSLQDDSTLSMHFDDGYGDDVFTRTATKQAESGNLDALAGTWKFGDWTFVFDGKGKVTV